MSSWSKVKNDIRLKLKNVKPIHYIIIVAIFVIFHLISPSNSSSKSTKNTKLPINISVDDYSAKVLNLYNSGSKGPIDFEWDQFLNIDGFVEKHKSLIEPLSCEEFGNRIRKSEKTRYNCIDDPQHKVPISLQENVLLYVDEMQRKIFAKVHLLKSFPNPSKLVYLFHDNKIEIDVNKEPKKLKSGTKDLSKEIPKLTSYKQDLSPKSPIELNYEQFNYRTCLNSYKEDSPVQQLHEKYKDTRVARKYFSEAYLLDAQGTFNLDWRFFNSLEVISKEYDTLNMAKMSGIIRCWLHFCEKFNIKSFISDNNLIGWALNGLHLPMEKDFNFHLPIEDLMKIIDLGLNQSIIFDYSDYDKKVHGQYFLDISPFFKMRDRNNQENTVDMRLIDIDSGLYIDLIALVNFSYEKLFNFKAKPILQSLNSNDLIKVDKKIEIYKDKKENLLYSKDLDIYRFENLNKLLPVKFENAIGYIPKDYMEILTNEYFEPLKTSRGAFKFREFLNFWYPLEWCKLPPFTSVATKEDDQECLKNPLISSIQNTVSKSTTYHEQFMEWFKNLDVANYNLKPDDLLAIIYH